MAEAILILDLVRIFLQSRHFAMYGRPKRWRKRSEAREKMDAQVDTVQSRRQHCCLRHMLWLMPSEKKKKKRKRRILRPST